MIIEVKVFKVNCPGCSGEGVVNGPLPVRGKVLRCPRCGCRFRASRHPFSAVPESNAYHCGPSDLPPPGDTPEAATGEPDVAAFPQDEAPPDVNRVVSREGAPVSEDRKADEPESGTAATKTRFFRKFPLFLAMGVIAVICLLPSGRMTAPVNARPVLLGLQPVRAGERNGRIRLAISSVTLDRIPPSQRFRAGEKVYVQLRRGNDGTHRLADLARHHQETFGPVLSARIGAVKEEQVVAVANIFDRNDTLFTMQNPPFSLKTGERVTLCLDSKGTPVVMKLGWLPKACDGLPFTRTIGRIVDFHPLFRQELTLAYDVEQARISSISLPAGGGGKVRGAVSMTGKVILEEVINSQGP